jgi:3-oxoacyl-[acyl-carrier protein] reductase|tara:strand:- start:722 stop:1483 length:762 start_codon:yes stop_codon:yes gene_type:complete
MKKIEEMSILITGGGSGIGAGAARYFSEQGAKVTICGRREANVIQVSKEIGPNCLGIKGDVTIAKQREKVLEAALNHGKGLDTLINSAADMLRGPISDLKEDELMKVFHTNVVSGMMLTGESIPYLKKSQGSIIFIGSVHTRRSFPGASPYAATKGALEALTSVLAAELGQYKIRVNCVIPGAVPTELNIRAGLFTKDEHDERMNAIAPLHVLERVGTSEEVAEAIDYLIRAEWTTGASMVVDGGLSLGMSPF